MTCYTKWEIKYTLTLSQKRIQIMGIYCMSYLRKLKKVEFSTWFYTFYFTLQLMKKQLISKFFYGNLGKFKHNIISFNGGSLSNDIRVFYT